ncbi:hypothetical protein KGF57_004563 [Candida theae]|uniref:Uncharacterized protein n=1 Tax=Candida theae TaxID=1198502 RepID=A0AAD5BAZ2_9ASCO|nr:uncharacterized protein KGF57_004563 [Candida theae]KAI5949740.1 hypothetical protein KGF57_004563 [Candida theae]
MTKPTYQIHELMNLRHGYYYDIQLPDLLLPRQKKQNTQQQNPHMVTLDYKSGKLFPVSSFVLLQTDTMHSNMQTASKICPPTWSPPLSSPPRPLSPTFQQMDYRFQGLMVPILNIDQELAVQIKSSPWESHRQVQRSPRWYNSPISPADPPPQNKPKDVVLEKSANVISSEEDTTSSDEDIVIQIHSSSPQRELN